MHDLIERTSEQGYQTPADKEIPASINLERIRFVLIEPSHPGNIGGAARAMKTMGLHQLYLVRPALYPHAEATARASGADDILAGVIVCQSLDEAIQDDTLVIGASTRPRNLDWPTLTPRSMAEQLRMELKNNSTAAAVLFGRERSGLSNRELERCHYRVTIPTVNNFSSLNLAAAVQVLAYECHLIGLGEKSKEEAAGEVMAHQEEVEAFFIHLKQALIDLDFLDPANPKLLMRRLRRLFMRTRLRKTEINILRGILSAAQKNRAK